MLYESIFSIKFQGPRRAEDILLSGARSEVSGLLFDWSPFQNQANLTGTLSDVCPNTIAASLFIMSLSFSTESFFKPIKEHLLVF